MATSNAKSFFDPNYSVENSLFPTKEPYLDNVIGETGDSLFNKEAGDFFSSKGYGTNNSFFGSDQFKTGLNTLNTLGNLTNVFLGFRQLGIAEDQLKHQKKFDFANFNNSVKNYNSDLEARARQANYLSDNQAVTKEQLEQIKLKPM